MKTIKVFVLVLFFYLPASPDNPAVHGDPREPPVYSWIGPPHTGCVSAVLCSAGLRIIDRQSLVCRTLMNIFFFNGKTWHGDRRNFWLKLAFMCSYIKQYSTLTNSKLCKHHKPYKIWLIGDRCKAKYEFFLLSSNLVWLLIFMIVFLFLPSCLYKNKNREKKTNKQENPKQ